MAGTLNLEVITPERKLVSMDADMLIIPGMEGYIGILPNHAPMVVELGIGVMRVRVGEEEKKYALGGGFLEVIDNKVSIVAYTAERADEIDVLRAREALRRAEARLQEHKSNVDYQRARIAVQKAMNRLEVANKK